jgi:hypothetical protein
MSFIRRVKLSSNLNRKWLGVDAIILLGNQKQVAITLEIIKVN